MRPIDMDDIDDYYEAEALADFLSQSLQVQRDRKIAREKAEQWRREIHPRTKIATFLRWMARKIELPE